MARSSRAWAFLNDRDHVLRTTFKTLPYLNKTRCVARHYGERSANKALEEIIWHSVYSE